MEILYTCDNNYVWLMGISIISLFENNKDLSSINVYLLGDEITDSNIDILTNIGKRYNRKITVINVQAFEIPDTLLEGRWPQSAFIRLYASQFLPSNLEKILYFDCDTIIDGSIRELADVELGDNLIFGIKDCIGKKYKENIGLDPEGIYVNAGVLLLNLKLLREMDVSTEIDKYMTKYLKYINYADQDILNGVFKDKIGILNPKYDVMTIDVVHSYSEILALRKPTNFYSEQELAVAIDNPTIVHYTTNMIVVRPWFSNSDHPLKDLFYKYAAISQWVDKKYPVMVFSSKEAKIIRIVNKLPHKMSIHILGVMHSLLKPNYIRIKAKMKK